MRLLIREGQLAATARVILAGTAGHPRHEFWPDDVPYADVPVKGIVGHRQADITVGPVFQAFACANNKASGIGHREAYPVKILRTRHTGQRTRVAGCANSESLGRRPALDRGPRRPRPRKGEPEETRMGPWPR